jgi:hypothetical protein
MIASLSTVVSPAGVDFDIVFDYVITTLGLRVVETVQTATEPFEPLNPPFRLEEREVEERALRRTRSNAEGQEDVAQSLGCK